MIPFCLRRHRTRTHTRSLTRNSLYSSILAKISASLKRKYSYQKKKRNPSNPLNKIKGKKNKQRTSSPTFIALPPQPGNKTLSPALTDVGTTRPSLSGAPGPTAITVASGSGLDVAEVGRNIPDAVFFEFKKKVHSFIGNHGRKEGRD